MLLVDTNLASVLWTVAPTEHPVVSLYWRELDGEPLAIALQTWAEAIEGAGRANWGTVRRTTQRAALARFTRLRPDDDTAEAWAALTTHAIRRGRALSAGDAWIGATAVRHGLTLVTHDADLDGLGFPGLDVVCRLGASGG